MATLHSTAKKQLMVLYGQAPTYSTSFQTTQLTAALTPWFDVRPVKVRNSSHPLLRKAYRVLGNSVKPFLMRKKADYILYANDGIVNVKHWKGRRLIYWYDAPWNWLESPPRLQQWV